MEFHFTKQLIAAVLTVGSAFAQPFTEIPGQFPVLPDSASAWGDFDGDGYLDLVRTGFTNNVRGGFPLTQLFKNDGTGHFVQIPHQLYASSSGSLAWGDYDRDGDLDLLMAGAYSGTALFRNNSGSFTTTGVTLPGLPWSTVAWADYNNDGRPDFVLGGGNGSFRTYVYKQTSAGQFVQATASLPRYIWTAINMNVATWGDFNNDGDFDLLLATENSGTGFLFDNIPSQFSALLPRSQAFNPPGAWISSVTFGDLDNDGWLDIIGTSPRSPASLWKNLHTNAFVLISNSISALNMGAVGMADSDNDGRIDILFSGSDSNGALTGLLHNQGEFQFTLTTLAFPDLGSRVELLWADIDNDGDLDCLVSSDMNHHGFVRLLRNDIAISNAPPLSPTGLVAFHTNGVSVFRWNQAMDANQNGGLSYNLRVGTASGKGNIMASMSLPGGRRLLPQAGNTGLITEWPLFDLPPGTYYWSVQSVDNGYAGSPFASEQVLVVPPWLFLTAGPAVNGRVPLSLTARPGIIYNVETSNDLKSWSRLLTIVQDRPTVVFDDVLSTGVHHRFYRATMATTL